MHINIIILALFLVAMIGVGIASRKKVSTINEFFLGSRKVGGILSAFAYATTYFSAVMFTLSGSLGYANGISVAWIGVGNGVIGGYLAWKVLAKRTRILSEELDVMTVPELISKKFDSKFLKIFLPVVIILFLTPYSASVYNGLSLIFSKAFEIDFKFCVLILAFTTALYVALGGYISSLLNSLVQGIIMVVAIVFFYVVFFSTDVLEGVFEGLRRLAQLNPELVSVTGPQPLFIIVTTIVTSFGAWGLPQMLHKFFSVKETEINRSAWLSGLFGVVFAGGIYFCGGFSALFVNGASALISPDMVMTEVLFQSTSPLLFAVMFVMLLSASMSTLSSVVLVSATTLTHDVMNGILKIKLADTRHLSLVRVLCIVFTAVSAILALYPNSIITLLSISWGALASTLLAPLIYALYSKRPCKRAAITASVCGFATDLGCFFIWGSAYSTYFACAAMIVSFVSLGIAVFFKAVLRKGQEVPSESSAR